MGAPREPRMPGHRNSSVNGGGRKVAKGSAKLGGALMAKRNAVKREARERRHGGEDKMIFKSALAMGMVGEAEMMDAHKGGSGIHLPGQHGRIESKLDMSDLEEMMYEAELAGRNFEADRNEATIIESGAGYTIESFSIEQLNQAREDHQSELRVPRRPLWDASTSKEQLDQAEKKDFLDWRRSLAALEENPMLVLSPFEKNLEVWKQLWRVVERSHIIIQIVDARNPLFFRCPDLEKYV